MRVIEKKEILEWQMYLGETCSESAACKNASKGDVRIGTATSHHCFDKAKRCSQQMKTENSRSNRKQNRKREKKIIGVQKNDI